MQKTKEQLKRELESRGYIPYRSKVFVVPSTRRDARLEQEATDCNIIINTREDDEKNYMLAMNKKAREIAIGIGSSDSSEDIMKSLGYKLMHGVFVYDNNTKRSAGLERMVKQEGYDVVRSKDYVDTAADEAKRAEAIERAIKREALKRLETATDKVIHYNLGYAPWTEREEAMLDCYKLGLL